MTDIEALIARLEQAPDINHARIIPIQERVAECVVAQSVLQEAAKVIRALSGAVEALRPFAVCAESFSEEYPDDMSVIPGYPDVPAVTLGDLRRAHKAFKARESS